MPEQLFATNAQTDALREAAYALPAWSQAEENPGSLGLLDYPHAYDVAASQLPDDTRVRMGAPPDAGQDNGHYRLLLAQDGELNTGLGFTTFNRAVDSILLHIDRVADERTVAAQYLVPPSSPGAAPGDPSNIRAGTRDVTRALEVQAIVRDLMDRQLVNNDDIERLLAAARGDSLTDVENVLREILTGQPVPLETALLDRVTIDEEIEERESRYGMGFVSSEEVVALTGLIRNLPGMLPV